MVALIVILLGIVFTAEGMSLRCGSALISTGDTKDKVIKNCGEPQSKESWTEERYPGYHHWPNYSGYWSYEDYRDQYRVPYAPSPVVKIDEWVYNFGSSRFIRYLRFENGRLKRIDRGDYGY